MPPPKRYTFNPTMLTILLTATVLVGVFGLLTMFTMEGVSEGKALCLVAAALAFGLASNALRR